jgi:hypothetical protein
LKRWVNFRYIDETHIGISFGETVEERDIRKLFEIFATVAGKSVDDKMIRELSGNRNDEIY